MSSIAKTGRRMGQCGGVDCKGRGRRNHRWKIQSEKARASKMFEITTLITVRVGGRGNSSGRKG